MRPSLWTVTAMAVLGGACTFTAIAVAESAPTESLRELTVCADPGNLPFSNIKLEGFENKIANLIAQEMNASPRFVWAIQRRGFLRRTLGAGQCDLLIGVPAGLPGVAVTRPYYTSTYAFVYARDRVPGLRDFDDPRLKEMRIGLHVIGAEGVNTPPARALAKRGLSGNVTGFPMWSDAEGDVPQVGKVVEAIERGDLDVAVIWGPFAGYFSRPYSDRVAVSTVLLDPRLPNVTFVYPMSLGVREGDDSLKAQVQAILDRRKQDIDAILESYGVPLVATAPGDSMPAVH